MSQSQGFEQILKYHPLIKYGRKEKDLKSEGVEFKAQRWN
jgi:hypothetical protein